MEEDVREALVNVCTSLERYDVDYLVVGGAAVSYHGYRRPSGVIMGVADVKVDLDFWYKPAIENFHNLTEALVDLGISDSDLKKIVFDPKKTFLKITHDTFHMDFLPVMAGLESYRESKKNADKVNFDGIQLYILSYDDLIANKKSVDRPIDRRDIQELSLRRPK